MSVSSLSQRLTDGLIGEDEHAGPRLYKPIRNEFRAQQRNKLEATIATIEADLKGLLPKKIVYPNPPADTSVLTPEGFDYYVAAAQFDYSYAAAYNQALADIDAAIEHYTRDKA